MNAESYLDVVFLEVVSQEPFGVDLFAMPLTSIRIRQGRDAVHQNLSKTNRTWFVQQLTCISSVFTIQHTKTYQV